MTELFAFSTPLLLIVTLTHPSPHQAPQPPPPPRLLLPPTWSLVVLAPHLHRVDQVGWHIHHQGLGLRLQHDALGLVLAPHDAEGHDGADADDEEGAAAGGGHDGQQHVLVVKLLRLLPCLRGARLDRLPATAAAATTARPWPPVGLGLDVGGGDVDLVRVPAGGVESLEERRRGCCCKSRRECQVLLPHAATECAGFSFPITICAPFFPPVPMLHLMMVCMHRCIIAVQVVFTKSITVTSDDGMRTSLYHHCTSCLHKKHNC